MGIRTLNVRLLNADIDVKNVLTVGEYNEIYRDKYTEELKQLKESILRGNDVKGW